MATTPQPGVSSNGSVTADSQPILRLATGKIDSIRKGDALSALDDEQWREWVTHLANRKSAASLAKLTGTKGCESLTWGLPETDETSETRQLLQSVGLHRKKLSGNEQATAFADGIVAR